MFSHSVKLLSIVILLLSFNSYSIAQRKVSEEAQLFKSLKDAVVTVFGDQGHGSGFIYDKSGLLLTNEHVIANSSHIRVQLDDSTKVSGTLVNSNQRKDIAIIRINPKFLTTRPTLKLAPRRDELAFEGEKVIAIGSPLHQRQILTSGIVSKVEGEAIISDVNINPGNSGGPLINMDGEVIAINTFSEKSPAGGPGISGSIVIWLANDLIDSVQYLVGTIPPPSAELLPVLPRKTFPLDALEAAATNLEKLKDIYDLPGSGDFVIKVQTPPYLYWKGKQIELELAKNRKEREKEGGANSTEQYNPFEDLRNWYQYGGEYAPVITLNVFPKIGETGGSIFGNLLGAALLGGFYHGTHTYEFKADLKEVALLRDGEPVPEIERGMQFVPLLFFQPGLISDARGSDLARAGVFLFRPDAFGPNGDVWPSLKLELTDLKDPKKPKIVDLSRKCLERIWLDFEPFREQRIADTTNCVVCK